MMNKQVKRVLIFIAGGICILLGIIGLAIPFLQGFVLIILGVVFLALSSKRFRTWLESHTKRYPRLHAIVQKTRIWAIGVVGDPDEEL